MLLNSARLQSLMISAAAMQSIPDSTLLLGKKRSQNFRHDPKRLRLLVMDHITKTTQVLMQTSRGSRPLAESRENIFRLLPELFLWSMRFSIIVSLFYPS
jgi:hypothetical protein